MASEHLLLTSYTKFIEVPESAADDMIRRVELPQPVFDQTNFAPVHNVGDMPRVVGQLVKLRKVALDDGRWELYGDIEWSEDYKLRPQDAPFISMELQALPQRVGEGVGCKLLEIAVTDKPIIECLDPIAQCDCCGAIKSGVRPDGCGANQCAECLADAAEEAQYDDH